MPVEVVDLQEAVVIEEQFLKTLKTLSEALFVSEGHGSSEASVVLVDDAYIAKLNKKYRATPSPTDVLSFPLGDEELLLTPEEGALFLGDVYISLDRASSQAVEYGHTFEREIAFLMSHGLLHLLGYNHETTEEEQKMRYKQEKILSIFNY